VAIVTISRYRRRLCYDIVWAGARCVSDLTDIFIRHRTEPSSPNLPAGNHTRSVLSLLTMARPNDFAPKRASLLALPDSPPPNLSKQTGVHKELVDSFELKCRD